MVRIIVLVVLILILLIIIKLSLKEPFENSIDISNFLKSIGDFIYVPNPGNGGDALIALGTYTLFDDLRLNYEIGDINKKYYNKTLVYAGGGNLVGIYEECENFLIKNKDNNKIIILPHTIKDCDKLLHSLGNNIIIFCRERPSYNYVLKTFKYKKNVFLSKDMAFYIKINSMITWNKGNGIGNFFRLDKEKTNINIPVDNIDLPSKINYNPLMNDKKLVFKTANDIFNTLNKYEIINTNRLHICIAGSFLNKKVNLYENSYYKNRAMYEYSIKDTYKNTKLIKTN